MEGETISREGYIQLTKQIDELKERRRRLKGQLEIALSFGDLEENADTNRYSMNWGSMRFV